MVPLINHYPSKKLADRVILGLILVLLNFILMMCCIHIGDNASRFSSFKGDERT